MSQNLIETVAEAAFAATRLAPWSDVDPLVRPLLLEEAKAAILATLEAIREPTDGMRVAALNATFDEMRGDRVRCLDAPIVWQAMVDALRAEIESAA
jgi:hypothetical protein